jgi:hypothetical protein
VKLFKRSAMKILGFSLRACRRLPVFPFPLLYALLNAALKLIELWRRDKLARVGEVTTTAPALPCSLMLWLDHISTDRPERQFAVCLRLPRGAADANLHEVFSVLLTSPRLRSVGFYWDESRLAEDLPLWQAKRDLREATGWSTVPDDLGSPSFKQLEAFFHASHYKVELPIAARRDAQTLLKRHAGQAFAVCLNLPARISSVAVAVATALPSARFFDLDPLALPSAPRATSILPLAGYGLNLHERMALVHEADAYVGGFDELGCVALASGRPAVLLDGGAGGETDRRGVDGTALWVPVPEAPGVLAEAVLQFLRRHTGSDGAG